MAGEKALRNQRIAAMAAARLARRLELVADMFSPDPDPLKDSFENALILADSHGHRYGEPCTEPYCQRLYEAMTKAIAPAAQQVMAPPEGGR